MASKTNTVKAEPDSHHFAQTPSGAQLRESAIVRARGTVESTERLRRAGEHDARVMPVAEAILDILESEGVRYIFGVPGGPLTGLFEAMEPRRTIRFVLAKHESGAAFMAAAYARVTGGLAVCCVTSGPGATNAITGITSAYADSLPVLLLTGQVSTKVFGKGAIQESSVYGVDVVELFRSVTKLSTMLPSVERSPDTIRSAIRIALSGRPGPAHISLPADFITCPVRYASLPPERYRATKAAAVDSDAVKITARLLAEAERPCFLVGHGVARANACEELFDLAHAIGARVATSPKGKGTFPENDPLSLGVFGFGGHDRAERYLQSEGVDVLVIIGSSMNEFVTNAWTARLCPSVALVQIDVDPTIIARNYPVDVAVVGDARAALHELRRHIAGCRNLPVLRRDESASQPAVPLLPATAEPAVSCEPGPVRPKQLVFDLRDTMPDDALLFVDNGNSILWATHYFEIRKAGTYFIDLGLSAMGSAVAGVVGAAMATPGRRVVALVGDAAFAMHGFEVHTAVEEELPVVWIVLNNGGHGMVRQGDTLMKGHDLGVSQFRARLDVAAFAEAVGARGIRAESESEFRCVIREVMKLPGPSVIDVRVDPDEIAPTLVRRVESLARFFASGGGDSLGGDRLGPQ